jgi:site-specific DNA recombinase
MSENLLQVAIYARVSSDHQAKAATIDSQVAALKKRVQENGHVAEEELCFLDDGYSGGTLVRPGLERLRDVAYAGAIDRVYVHSPDRLARKYAYQVLLVDELTKAGVEVVFLNHTISDSPEDELLLQMQGMIAEYERAKILERSRRGKRHAARRGSVNVLSGAPYGYRYISKQEGEGQARYEILEEEASVVQQVFQWIGRDGISIGEVRRRLHDQGVKTKTGKDWWDRATIWAMLKNPAYKGSAAFGKTRVGKRLPQLRPQRGQAEQPRKSHSTYDTLPEEQESIPVPALVEEALFDAVAEQLVENKRRNRQGGRGAKYLLQGLLQCACCNYSYYGKQLSRSGRHGKKVDYAYYRCIGTDAYRFAGERVCDNKQVRTDLLEESVWDDICQLLRDPDRVRLEYERRLEGGSQQAFARRKQLETTIHKVQRAIARLIDIYEEGLLTKEEFEPRIRASKSRLSKLQEEEMTLFAEQSEQAQLHVVIDHLEAFQEQLAGGLDELDWHARREVIRLLVKRVEIDRNEVRIIYKVSPPPFASSPASGACLQDCCRGNHAALRRSDRGGFEHSIVHYPRCQKLLD